MKCSELVERIEQHEPEASPYDVARLAVLMTNHVEEIARLDSVGFEQAWRDMALRLQAVTDQHEAIAEELKLLSQKPPESIGLDDIWTLMKIIKVQLQVLKMYTAPPEWMTHS